MKRIDIEQRLAKYGVVPGDIVFVTERLTGGKTGLSILRYCGLQSLVVHFKSHLGYPVKIRYAKIEDIEREVA